MVERRGVLQAVKAIVVALALLCASPAYAVVAHAKSDGGFCGGGRNGNMPSACASTNTTTFTYTPNATGGQILFGMTCAATGGTPSAVSLTASGWTTTQIGTHRRHDDERHRLQQLIPRLRPEHQRDDLHGDVDGGRLVVLGVYERRDR
jgi:hypothetical protein